MRWLASAFALWPFAVFADAAPGTEMRPVADGAHVCVRFLTEWVHTIRPKGTHGGRIVKLAFRVGTDGSVKDLAIAQSSDDASADSLATRCVAGWRYHPVMKDGQPVEVPWTADVYFSLGSYSEPAADVFDAAASNPAAQTCKTVSAAELEEQWSVRIANRYARFLGANDGFECVNYAVGEKVCRAKPGTALYPTQVESTLNSTGTRLKVGVEVQTTGGCKAAFPVTFKGEVPTPPSSRGFLRQAD